MRIQIVATTIGPVGKLADAELVFEDGDGILAGTKLVGFAVWEGRETGTLNVTLPTRQYTVNGERRRFVLVRPVEDNGNATERLREAIEVAYRQSVNGAA